MVTLKILFALRDIQSLNVWLSAIEQDSVVINVMESAMKTVNYDLAKSLLKFPSNVDIQQLFSVLITMTIIRIFNTNARNIANLN